MMTTAQLKKGPIFELEHSLLMFILDLFPLRRY